MGKHTLTSACFTSPGPVRGQIGSLGGDRGFWEELAGPTEFGASVRVLLGLDRYALTITLSQKRAYIARRGRAWYRRSSSATSSFPALGQLRPPRSREPDRDGSRKTNAVPLEGWRWPRSLNGRGRAEGTRSSEGELGSFLSSVWLLRELVLGRFWARKDHSGEIRVSSTQPYPYQALQAHVAAELTCRSSLLPNSDLSSLPLTSLLASHFF